MTPKLSNLNIVLGYWNENPDSCFRFNNSKTMFKLDNFGVILFVSFSYKKLLQCSFYENLKIDVKIDFFAKNSKKFVYYNEELVANSNAIISKTTTIQNLP